MEKTRIPYYEENNNPHIEGVTYVVIQTDSCPVRVAKTYSTNDKRELLELPDVFVTLHIGAAKQLFNFMSIAEYYKNNDNRDSIDSTKKALEGMLAEQNKPIL